MIVRDKCQGTSSLTRVVWAIALTALTAVGCTKGGGGASPAKAPVGGEPAVASTTTSGLTALSRTGWTPTASTTTNVGLATDGSLTTAWRSPAAQASTQWFQVDLGAIRSFVEIRLDSATAPTEFPRNFKVQVANDTTSWGTAPSIATVTGLTAVPTGHPGVVTVAFAPQAARYIRVSLTASNAAFWSIYDFSVYGTAHARTLWTASSPSGGTPANALDGSATTLWTSTTATGTTKTFQLDMKSQQTFNRITLDSAASTNFPGAYSVFATNDTANWGTAIATGTGSTAFVAVNFTTQRAQHLKVTSTANTWTIAEINVEGQPTTATQHQRTGWTASSLPSAGTPANALDGSTSTRWTSGGQAGQSFTANMQSIRLFDQIVLDAGTGTGNLPGACDVQVSNEATDTSFVTVMSFTGSTQVVTVTLPQPRTAQYVRIKQTGATGNAWSIQELTVSGPALSQAGWTAIVPSTSSANIGALAMDGSASTRWTSSANQASGQVFQVDLGATHVFNQLTMDAGSTTAANFPGALQVFVSTDATTWGSAIATMTGTARIVTVSFPTKTARHIRVSLTAGKAANTPWTIEEFNIARLDALCDSVGDDSNPCTIDACDPLTGQGHKAGNSGTSCRAAVAGGCDVAETCTGTSATCPTDVVATVGTTCRTAAAGGCDVAEVCNGTLPTCPANAFAPSTTVCRTAVAGGCDVAESCTGASATCPTDVVATVGTTCRTAVAGGCDVAEVCNGTLPTCPANAFAPSTTVCRTAVAGGCDVAESCPGNSATCPADTVATVGTTCRTAVPGGCDVAEVCNGTLPTCPADAVVTVGTTCRVAVAGGCDVAEVCNGTLPTCPTNAFAPSTTVCRAAAAGGCDVAESCPGNAAACPADGKKTNGSMCSDDNACTTGETCQTGVCTNGTGVTCPQADSCHTQGACVPATGCPALVQKDDFTPCPDNNACDGLEFCSAGSCVDEVPGTWTTCAGPTRVTFHQSYDSGLLANIGHAPKTPLTSVDYPRVPGLFGNAMDSSWFLEGFDLPYRTDDPAANPPNIAFSKPGSLSIWIKPTALFEATTLLVAYETNAKLVLGVQDNHVVASLENAGDAYTSRVTAEVPRSPMWTPDNWHLIVVNWTAYGLAVFLDGVSSPVVGAPWMHTFPAGPKKYDLLYAGPPWSGSVTSYLRDELMVLNRPMTQTEIAWYYAQRLTPGPTNPAILFFDQAPGTCNLADDLNPCTTDTCSPTTGIGRLSLANGTQCLDGNVCNGTETCQTGTCTATAGTALTCPSGICENPRTCDPASGCLPVTPKPDNTACDDGLLCTGPDKCTGGICGGAPVTCQAWDGCHTAGTCSPTTGACSAPASGSSCNDGNSCTANDTCQASGECHGTLTCQEGQNPLYAEITDLGTTASGSITTYGVNSAGSVVGGEGSSTGRIWAWRHTGAMQQIAFADSQIAMGQAINTGGTVAGGTIFGSTGAGWIAGTEYPFAAAIGQTPLVYTDSPGWAYGINDIGQVVGVDKRPGTSVQAFRITSGARLLLPLPPGTGWHWSTATGIGPSSSPDPIGFTPSQTVGFVQTTEASHADGNGGQFTVGWGIRKAFSHDDTNDSRDLNNDPIVAAHPEWGLLYSANATNGRQITGWGVYRGRCRAFRLTPGVEIKDMGVLIDTPYEGYDACLSGGTFTYYQGNAINSRGDVVGTAGTANWPERAFYYSDTTGMVDLNTLIDPTLGYTLTTATGINDAGEIVGTLMRSGDTRWHGYKMKLPAAAQNPGGQNITVTVAGIVDVGIENGVQKYMAVFSYLSTSSPEIHIPPSEDGNSFRRNGVKELHPNPAPPVRFTLGSNPGAFLPKGEAGETLAWKLAGLNHPVTITPSSMTPLAHEAIGTTGGYGVRVPDPSSPTPNDPNHPPMLVTIVPDMDQFLATPQPPGGQQPEPQDHDATEFNGTLQGSLSVSPSGAAIYTVPITIPPGIGGMAPNLSLIYNSQGGNGVAGQGWELGGLSMIHRCAKTRVQDGHSRPVVMDPLGGTDEGNTDGICLDGQRLFESPPGSGNYLAEHPDFSTISKNGDFFVVVTKSGELRYYGIRENSRVILPRGAFDPGAQTVSGSEIAAWPLDRVVDDWGNYFELYYNDDAQDFTTKGIRVTSIKYTGHMNPQDNSVDVQPFHEIKFWYASVPRPDVRWARFGASRIPRNALLSQIETPTGYYSLAYYFPFTDYLPTRMSYIEFCDKGTPSACLKKLEFGWEGGTFGWTPTNSSSFKLPNVIDSDNNGQFAPKPTQFADLNADGLIDFIAWDDIFLNNGTGFQMVSAKMPEQMLANNGVVKALLADVNGDGRPDLVTNTAVYINDFKSGRGNIGQGGFTPTSSFANVARDFGRTTLPDRMADMNGDGLADLVTFQWGVGIEVEKVYLSSGTNWAEPMNGTVSNTSGGASTGSSNDFLLTISPAQKFVLDDFNRDGMADFVAEAATAGSGGQLFKWVWMNTGDVSHGQTISTAALTGATKYYRTLWKGSRFRVDSGANALAQDRFGGDLDGDGLHDAITVSPVWDSGQVLQRVDAKVALSTGLGYQTQGAEGYLAGINAQWRSWYAGNSPGVVEPRLAFADINADGLVDMIRGEDKHVFINTGSGWVEGPTPAYLPIVPLRHTSEGPVANHPAVSDNGATFLDLNGDGLVDIAHCSQEGALNSCTSWINDYVPPRIKNFPNGLANQTSVKFVALTEVATHYVDNEALAPSTARANIPLLVVDEVDEDNGVGGTKAKLYSYRDLRAANSGRGAQGFGTVTITDSSAHTHMITKYAQAYPYSGLPTDVERYTTNVTDPRTQEATLLLVSKTHTDYCDTASGSECSPPTGVTSHTGPWNFVYPRSVTDTGYLYNSTANGGIGSVVVGTTTTNTQTVYDAAGNPSNIVVLTGSSQGETYVNTSINFFGNSATDPERRRGKLTGSIVRIDALNTDGSVRASREHHTNFEYGFVEPTHSLALLKKTVEAGKGVGTELRSIYSYDLFGNVTKTTSCAANFANCAHDSPDANMRTTTVSYDPASFSPPSGSALLTSVPYGKGRFPVKTTNALGYAEYTIYDPRFGSLQQKTGPNGITTCFGHNALGRQVSSTERCGQAPLTTTAAQYLASAGNSVGATAVTVSTPPVGAGGRSWVYTDVFGRTIRTLTRAFDGGFTKVDTVYDQLARVHQQSKPVSASGGMTTYWTTTDHDPLGRPWRITHDLGDIDGSGDTSSAVEIKYEGTTVVTTETVRGEQRVRRETKNLLGKVSSVIAEGKEMTFGYDPDGNLTLTHESATNEITTEYDILNRKKWMTDPDLGHWSYTYTGFGELKTQTDAKGQVVAQSYDKLGRMIRKTERAGQSEFESEWVYDVAEGAGIGKLAAMVGPSDPKLQTPCTMVPTIPVTLTSGNRALKYFSYTSFGEVDEASECADNMTFTTTYRYDSFGRQRQIEYPHVGSSHLVANYNYTANGFLHYIGDVANKVYWAAKEMDAQGHVTSEYTRNGVTTVGNRNQATGWLRGSYSVSFAAGGKAIQSWEQKYDTAGNLVKRLRTDDVNAANSDETFTYDRQDRLLTSQVKVGAYGYDQTESFGYDALGNITSKGGKSYAYTGCVVGGGPHTVCKVGNGSAFSYDLNGNMIVGSDRSIDYDMGNKVTRIVGAQATVEFAYGGDANRVVQMVTSGTATERTIYVGLGSTGKSLLERTTRQNGAATTVETVQFLYAGGGGNAVALSITADTGSGVTEKMQYQHFDHLGSVTAQSDERGRVIDVWSGGADTTLLGYDPWGARRNPVGQQASGGTFNLLPGHREFTGHETIPGVGLVNMNGRVYDPALGRFLSPDPNVQFSGDLQSYNRYSYVLNNPLRYADPTGYFIDSGFDFLVNFAITGASLAICAGTSGVGCGLAFAMLATVYNTASAINSGASWQQAVGYGMAGLAIGMAGGAFGSAIGDAAGLGLAGTLGKAAPLAGHVISGAVGTTVSSALMSGVTGHGMSGKSLLLGIAQSAFWAGVQWGVAYSAKLSDESIEEALVAGAGAVGPADDVSEGQSASTGTPGGATAGGGAAAGAAAGASAGLNGKIASGRGYLAQEFNNSCVAASTGNAIYARTGVRLTEASLRLELAPANHNWNTNGIDPNAVVPVLHAHGLTTAAAAPNATTIPALTATVAHGPAMIRFNVAGGGGHRVILMRVGADATGGAMFTVLDPGLGAAGGSVITPIQMTQAQFQQRWMPNGLVIKLW